jgi:tetratricopeptide (TPR) repeat protein
MIEWIYTRKIISHERINMRGNFPSFSIILPLALLFFASPSLSKGQAIEQGRIIATVVCQYDRSQSYALYLPSGYTPEKRWPIIYAFDPGAMGQTPVKLFQEAAEKYGYIVAGSNNSRNGPWENNMKAGNAVWVDTHIRFRIDDERIYTTGFSGGARMASGLSSLLKKPVAGIIACGAGLPGWLTPDKIAPAAFFGLAGLADLNYKEIKRLDNEFDSLNTVHRTRIFDGSHDWPPRELCEEALEWMELQAVKQGKKEKEPAYIEQLYKQGLSKAKKYVDSGNTHEAFQIYEALREEFSDWVDVSEADDKAIKIKEDPNFKLNQKQERQALEEELRLIGEMRENFWNLKKNIGNTSERETLVNRFRLDRLLEQADKAEDPYMSLMAKRLLQDFSYNVYEQGEISFEAKDYSTAAFLFEMVAVSSSHHPGVLYMLASAYSLNNEKEKALRALRQAVEKGFSDGEQLEKDVSFDPIREEREFKAILEGLKKIR